MSRKKQNQLSHQSLYRVVVIVSLVMLALAIGIVSSRLGYLERQLAESVFKQNQFTLYEHAKLTFCHDHEIRPCDVIAIKEWNTSHPDDTFPVDRSSQ